MPLDSKSAEINKFFMNKILSRKSDVCPCRKRSQNGTKVRNIHKMASLRTFAMSEYSRFINWSSLNRVSAQRSFGLKTSYVLWLTAAALMVGGCTSKQQVEKVLADNPEIVFQAIKK